MCLCGKSSSFVVPKSQNPFQIALEGVFSCFDCGLWTVDVYFFIPI
jgi:hypothetical protein